MQDSEIKSVLRLDKVVFDKIEFKRIGFKNDKDFEFKIESNVSRKENEELYRSSLVMNGRKEGEYELEISISGFFILDRADELAPEIKTDLVSKNTVAILMPYLRSEVTLLTAQPETEPLVLPVFNTRNMFKEHNTH
ncbi:MAG: hypothetical protein ACI4PO_00205 [Faecousia sp.]